MGTRTATVLVVEPETGTRDAIGAAVEDAGFDVLTCPGPTGPDYLCVGVRGPGCPLAAYADAVVLDLALDSDLALEGTTSVELIGFYLSQNKVVVVLGRDDASEGTRPFAEEGIEVVRWPADREKLVSRLRSLLVSRGWDPAAPTVG